MLGGGSASLGAIVGLAALTWPVALLGSRRQRGVRELFPTLAIAQVGGHAVLAFFGGAGSGAASCGAVPGHPGHVVLDCADPLGATAAMHGAHGSTPMMTLGHLAAAFAVAILFAHGEAILWRVVVTLTRPRLPRLAPLGLAARPLVSLVGRRPGRCDLAVVSGRGPPVAA